MLAATPDMQYRFDECPLGWALRRRSFADQAFSTVDYIRTRAAVEYAVRELMAGRAHLEAHRPVGCRVQPAGAAT